MRHIGVQQADAKSTAGKIPAKKSGMLSKLTGKKKDQAEPVEASEAELAAPAATPVPPTEYSAEATGDAAVGLKSALAAAEVVVVQATSA